jgi:hypothetical protein
MPTRARPLRSPRLATIAALLASGAAVALAPSAASAASLPSFCAHISASAVSSVMGATLKESGAVYSKTTTCTFEASGASILTGSVVLSDETGIPADISGDYAKETAAVKQLFAKEHLSIKFKSLGSGSFTYSATIAGFSVSGIEGFKGGTEYDAAVYRSTPLSKLEALLKLEESAG